MKAVFHFVLGVVLLPLIIPAFVLYLIYVAVQPFVALLYEICACSAELVGETVPKIGHAAYTLKRRLQGKPDHGFGSCPPGSVNPDVVDFLKPRVHEE